ncbi:MAG: hypothetical protein ACTSPQ_21195, partial [Candidatus Helarchaeota archaeon]
TFNYETEYTYIKTDKELSLDEETITPVEEEQVFSSNKSNIIYTNILEEGEENYLTLNITYDIYLDKSDNYIKYSSEEQLNLTYNSLNIRKYILLNNLLEKSSSEYTNYTYTLKNIYLKKFTDLRGNLTFYSGITNQSQTLTYERAYNGLYAYKNEVSNCLEFKTVIDIPHVSYFPRKITFYSYSTNYKYELRFYIDNYYKTLKTFDAGMWLYTGEGIDRSDYIINNTNSEIKFVIIAQESNVTETIDNLLIIDDLEITYTDYRYQFNGNFDFANGEPSDSSTYTYNYSSSFLRFKAEDMYYPYGNIIEYSSELENPLYTRRVFLKYSLELKDNDINEIEATLFNLHRIYIDQYYSIYFSIKIETNDTNNNYYDITYKFYIYTLAPFLYGYLVHIENTTSFLQLGGLKSLDIEYSCIQLDYNTLSTDLKIVNNYVNNSDNFAVAQAQININEEEIKNNFPITTELITSYNLYAYAPVSFPDYKLNFETYLNIYRDIKHSETQTFGGNPDKPFIKWDQPFFDVVKDILRYIITYFYTMLTFFVRSLMYLKEILAEIINIKNILSSIENWIMGISQTIDEIKNIISTNGITINSILQILGEINDYIPGIAGDIGNIADTIIDVFNVLKDVYDMIVNLDTSVTNMEDFITNDLLNDLEEMASDIETELATYDVLDFFNFGLNLTNYWKLGDWTSFTNEYSSFFPSTETVFENIIDVALEPFYFLFGGHNVGIIISKSLSFFEQIVPFIYILLMMYMYRILKLINARDWEALKDEIETVIRIINYVFRFIWKTFDFIFRMIHAILDVAIPLT